MKQNWRQKDTQILFYIVNYFVKNKMLVLKLRNEFVLFRRVGSGRSQRVWAAVTAFIQMSRHVHFRI